VLIPKICSTEKLAHSADICIIHLTKFNIKDLQTLSRDRISEFEGSKKEILTRKRLETNEVIYKKVVL
jgi:hypothetical protein